MSCKREIWETDIQNARIKWESSKDAEDYEVYALACATFLCSEAFELTNEHWFCGGPKLCKIALSSLIIFSFTLSEESDEAATIRYRKYDNKFSEMIGSCTECAIKYQTSDETLLHELIDLAGIEESRVLLFFNTLHSKDRARLTRQLQKNKHDVSALTEVLWSYACLMGKTFVNTNLIESGILTGSSTAFNEVEACPGFLMLSFMHSYAVRQNAMHKILKPENTKAFIETWKRYPAKFNKMFSHGLKRNINAKNWADLAWFTAASFLNKLGEDETVRTYIVKLCADGMMLARGQAKFGGHSLMLQILKNNQAQSSTILTSDDIEKLLDCVTRPVELKYQVLDPDAPEAALKSESYRSLSASIITECIRLYVSRNPSPTSEKVLARLSYLLSLEAAAFKSTEDFDVVTKLAAKVCSVYTERSLVELVFDQHSQRMAEAHSSLKSSWICKVWAWQIGQEELWCSFWDIFLSRSDLLKASGEDGDGTLVGILQGSKAVALKYVLPPNSEKNKFLSSSRSQTCPTRSEVFVKSALELLVDSGDASELSKMLLDKHVLRSVLFLSVSGNRELSLMAEEYMKQAFGEDIGDSYVHNLVGTHAESLMSALNSMLSEAAPASASWLAVMPGLIRLASTILDQIYSIHDGVETTSSNDILKLLHIFWVRSWAVLSNVIKSLRSWSKEYASSHVKSVLIAVLEFSQSLLSKFRLIDADLSTGLANTANWGEKLAEPVISCINNMNDMLQLAIPDLLAMAVSTILEILGLMKSFSVGIPSTLMSLLQGLATKRLNSNLSKDQLRDLLLATNLNEQEITDLIDQKRGYSSQLTTAERHHPTSPAVNKIAGRQQRAIGDYFKSSGSTRPQIHRIVADSQILPQSPHQSSGVNLVREQIRQNQLANGNLGPSIVNKPIGPIHPERPPGFNPQKPHQKLTHSSDDDDDDNDDDDGALRSLGAQQKRERAASKLREAYEQSKNRKPQSHLLPDLNGVAQARSAQQQYDDEARAMKLRLSTKPTELHRQILNWNCCAGRPPFRVNESIPDQFDSVSQYQAIMSPLLFLEAWEQIQNAKEESRKCGPSLFLLVFGKRVKVDGFTDVYVSVTKDVFTKFSIGEGDLLVLSYDKTRPAEVVEYSAGTPCCYAMIKEGSIKKYGNSPKNPYVDFQIRIGDQPSFLSPLNSGSQITGYNLGGVRTLEREFTALMALPYFDLLDSILKAKPSVAQDQPVKVARFQENMSLNYSQAVAVSRCFSNKGLSLIQGPPGTGKTKTILGIVGAYFTSNDLVAQATNRPVSDTKKILICAPSNAAVDEIVLRLKDGVTDANGKHQKLNLLRLGRSDVVSNEVKDVTLEEILSRNLTNVADSVDEKLRQDHSNLTARRNELRDRLNQTQEILSPNTVTALTTEFKNVSREIREKNFALDQQRERLNLARKQSDLQTRQLQNEIVKKAQVVCATLSASAHPLLATVGSIFETVIIDEAAQCIELSSLIPLKYGCKHCIMVGDPNQLPPTVISQAAAKLKYEQSLFVRIFDQNKISTGAVSMLDTQFRMHPAISQFPSLEFYDGKLKDAEGLSAQLTRPWHKLSSALGPYKFFEIDGRQERVGRSLRNVSEATAAVDLASYITRSYPEIRNVGIISPYRDQVKLMQQMFADRNGPDSKLPVAFNTIDGFQGQEKEIIIISCVRGSDTSLNSIGFLSDMRRINVAITRAKASLWILGNPSSLSSNPVWRALLSNAKDRGNFVPACQGGIMRVIRAEFSTASEAQADFKFGEVKNRNGVTHRNKAKKKRKVSEQNAVAAPTETVLEDQNGYRDTRSNSPPSVEPDKQSDQDLNAGLNSKTTSTNPPLDSMKPATPAQHHSDLARQNRERNAAVNHNKVNLFIPAKRPRSSRRV